MTGHRPWETLLERLSLERREAIAAGAARIRADIERRLERSQVAARDEAEARGLNTERERPTAARAPAHGSVSPDAVSRTR